MIRFLLGLVMGLVGGLLLFSSLLEGLEGLEAPTEDSLEH